MWIPGNSEKFNRSQTAESMSTELNELTKPMPGGKCGAVWLSEPAKSDTQSTSKPPCISFLTAVQVKHGYALLLCCSEVWFVKMP